MDDYASKKLARVTAFRRNSGSGRFAFGGRCRDFPPSVAASDLHLQGVAPTSPHAIQPYRLNSSFAPSSDIPNNPATVPAPNRHISVTRPLGGRKKRILDIMIASLALVLLCPLMLIIMVLIKVFMGGPVIFAHRRIGFDGRTFHCYKFRTMIDGAEELLTWHLASNPRAEKEWREVRKLEDDPRITPLGQILRKSSLDELPQLLNILQGHMSCVGPRPIVADELRHYGEYAEEYMKVRPGLTGLWQVSGRNSLQYNRRVALDLHYVRNWSIWTDVVILFKTAFAMANFNETS